jgi:hypothetical protein
MTDFCYRGLPLYMFMSCHQNVGQYHNMEFASISFENVIKFRYLGMTVSNE